MANYLWRVTAKKNATTKIARNCISQQTDAKRHQRCN